MAPRQSPEGFVELGEIEHQEELVRLLLQGQLLPRGHGLDAKLPLRQVKGQLVVGRRVLCGQGLEVSEGGRGRGASR